MRSITLTMIKPEAVADGHAGAIIDMFLKGGFRIVAMKMIRLTGERAGQFYAVHRERPFYNALVSYMSSGPIIAAVLEKDNAVDDFRKLIGATDPGKAEGGTVRKLFGKSIEQNTVHGSDSNENAQIEARFFFSQLELH
jgi:nucleoside-diphosphate kinase